jgi:hypothetical protein
MAEIVNSLFGVSPEMLQQARAQRDYARNLQAVQLTPMQQGNLMLRQGATELGNAGMGLLGVEDPEMQKVTAIKQLSSQFDLTSAAGMRDFARALQPIAPNESMMAAKRADELDLGAQQIATQRSQELRNLREPTRTAFSQLVASGKYTPASIALYEKSQNPADLVLVKGAVGAGEGDGIGKPGPVGKSGAFRDISGTILGPAEMKTVRQEFEGAQKLLNTLNQISAQDVKDAESYIDWTTKAETKGLASDKTLKAQTKVAASQLLEQINQLPPGSASDADMRAAMKSFPGYSNPEALAEWVNRTKGLLQFSINRGVDQFGFTARIQPTAPLDLSKKKTQKPAAPATGGWSIVK